MDGNNENINREYESLKCSLYNHFLLFLTINAFNIILFITMPFLNKVYYAVYLCCLIMYIIFFTIPFHPLILLYKKKLYTKVVICWKKLSLALIFIILFFAILINVTLFLNIHYLLNFYKECPYNYSYSDIINIFNIDYNDYNNNLNNPYTSKCSDNRCVLFQENSESPIPISYLCNFDSSIDFESILVKIARKIFFAKVNKDKNNTEVYCQEFNRDNFSNTEILTFTESNENFYIIKSYFDLCSSERTFYQCFRYEKPKQYEIGDDFSCPKVNNIIINLLITIIAFFFNLFLSLTISIFEFMKYKKILILYRANVIESVSTRGTTKNSSQARGSNNENNHNNNENENVNNNDIHSDTIIIKISEEEEDKGNKININDNLISTEGVLTINRISCEINNGLEENNNTSERKGINSKFNLILKNETGINATNTTNSIDFNQINFNDNNDNDKNQNEIYTFKIK